MKAKIDLEKFISSMLGYAEDNCEETMLDYLHSALQDQGLEYKDGEIVEIDTIDTSSPRWAEIVKECKHDALEQAKKFDKERLFEVAKPETLEEKVEHWQRMHDIAMEKIKGTFKEEDSPETKAIKEQIENLKKRIEDNQLGCIVQRLDKIIELLQSAILILPKEPYVPPIIYKRPLDPDPNVLGGWTTTASTFGSDYDIDTDKIK